LSRFVKYDAYCGVPTVPINIYWNIYFLKGHFA
jgi:hypothetical protein